MNKAVKPKLISYELCPFGQRSVIILAEKAVDYDLTYLDLNTLDNPPDWLVSLSPLGKIPVLCVEQVSLFESAVINEYLDEIFPLSMHPCDSLIKAHNRSWIEFATELLACQYSFCIVPDKSEYQKYKDELLKKLNQLENTIKCTPFFNGADFSLIDAAYAPAFMRFDILESLHPIGVYRNRPKISLWAEELRGRVSVVQSIVPGFAEKFLKYIRDKNSYAATALGLIERAPELAS